MLDLFISLDICGIAKVMTGVKQLADFETEV